MLSVWWSANKIRSYVWVMSLKICQCAGKCRLARLSSSSYSVHPKLTNACVVFNRGKILHKVSLTFPVQTIVLVSELHSPTPQRLMLDPSDRNEENDGKSLFIVTLQIYQIYLAKSCRSFDESILRRTLNFRLERNMTKAVT